MPTKRPFFVSILAICIISFLSAFVSGQEGMRRAGGVSADGAMVTLSLKEFEDIFTSATLQDAKYKLLEQEMNQKQQYDEKVQKLLEEQRQKRQREEKKEQETNNRKEMFPQNFQVLQYSASGIYNTSSPISGVEQDVAMFDLELTLRIMESPPHEWTTVPLVNTSSTVATNWQVLKESNRDDASAAGERDGAFFPIDTISDPSILFYIREDQQVLATNQSGLFQIKFQVYTRVAKTRNVHQMGLSSLLYPLSDFSFRIAKEDETTTVLKDFSINPASAVLRVQDSAPPTPSIIEEGKNEEIEDDDENVKKDSKLSAVDPSYTDLQATLPLTADSIQIRWTRASKADHSQKQKQKQRKDSAKESATDGTSRIGDAPGDDMSAPQVTAIHQVLHTIEEGILRSVHTLEYQSSNREESSPLSSVSFYVHGGEQPVRVTSVVAHALQSWSIVEEPLAEEAVKDSKNGTMPSLETKKKSKHAGQLIKAYFKTSQLDSSGVTLQVHTETDRDSMNRMKDDDDDDDDGSTMESLLELPRVECRNVLRQTGFVAIIKDANVEVHEEKIQNGLSRCEPTDLSSQLRLNVDRPIVLSYKYVNPQNTNAILNVKEHLAMETLDAAIDRVHYKGMVTSTHTLHSMILMLQSTKLQYLKIHGIPASASKFTVLVNSVPVKPVRGSGSRSSSSSNGNTNDSTILIPLLVGLQSDAANEGRTLRTSVELTYFSTLDEPLTIDTNKNGTLALDPPYFDLPISVYTAQLRLPKAYRYQFSGDMGAEPLEKLSFPTPEPYTYKKGKRVVRGDHEFTIVDDFWPEDFRNDDGDDVGGQSRTVQIQTPRSGRSYFFQKLLVVDKKLNLNVKYREPKSMPVVKTPWWKKLFLLKS